MNSLGREGNIKNIKRREERRFNKIPKERRDVMVDQRYLKYPGSCGVCAMYTILKLFYRDLSSLRKASGDGEGEQFPDIEVFCEFGVQRKYFTPIYGTPPLMMEKLLDGVMDEILINLIPRKIFSRAIQFPQNKSIYETRTLLSSFLKRGGRVIVAMPCNYYNHRPRKEWAISHWVAILSIDGDNVEVVDSWGKRRFIISFEYKIIPAWDSYKRKIKKEGEETYTEVSIPRLTVLYSLDDDFSSFIDEGCFFYETNPDAMLNYDSEND